ncbi:MAG TPA: multidrug effflux MFS transporter [Burkholderiales bacterium]|nr:multidrug effflux MFS transporter [Burkholderiales bacterium]
MTARAASSFLTVLLGVLIGLTALGMDLFLPSVPAIAQAFDAEPGMAQLAVTTYLLGLAAGQFAWGPLADRFGRKPVLLTALGLFFVSSVACAAAQSLTSVVLLRFAQGAGMSSGPVIARTVVRDLAAHEEAAQLLGRMTIVFGFFPVAGPLVGAQVLALAGWTSVFWFYAAFALVLLVIVALGFPETAPAERAAISPAGIAARYALLLGDRRFVAPLATALCAQMGILAFVASSSLVLVQAMRLTPTAFSLLFAAVMLGQMAGGFAGSRLVARLGIERMVRLGTTLALVAGALLAILVFAGVTHWSAIVLPMLGYIFGCALLIPNATAAALTPFPLMAGAASSLLGVLPFSLGALVSAVLGAAFDGTARPLALAIAVAGAGAFASEQLLFGPAARAARAARHG